MLAARSNKRMGTEKVKKEEVVQRSQLDNKSPIQVHHDEGVASHIGPEPCASLCEEAGEASAGERIGQPLSRESYMILGADALQTAEGHMDGARNRERPHSPARSKTLACAEAP